MTFMIWFLIVSSCQCIPLLTIVLMYFFPEMLTIVRSAFRNPHGSASAWKHLPLQ